MTDGQEIPSIETVVYGNFGDPHKTESSGQIIRTKEVCDAISAHPIVSRNTEINYGRRKTRAIAEVYRKLRTDSEIFVLPGKRMLLILGIFFFVARLVRLVTARIHLVAIGGWLPGMIQTVWGRIAIASFDSVSTQLPSMTANINSPNNKYWLPNFRNFDTSGLPPRESSDTVRLIHISRLIREKGVFESLETARVLAENGVSVSLSIYGPDEFSSKADSRKFLVEIEETKDLVTYCGDLPQDQVIPTIAAHDFVLFPSTYSGEGFPGVIVESLIAGTPVIALGVGYIPEILEYYEFGFVIETAFPSSAAEVIVEEMTGGGAKSRGGDDLTGHSRVWEWLEEVVHDPWDDPAQSGRRPSRI